MGNSNVLGIKNCKREKSVILIYPKLIEYQKNVLIFVVLFQISAELSLLKFGFFKDKKDKQLCKQWTLK